MLFQIFAVRDALNGFLTPMVEPSEAVARRNFNFAMVNNNVLGFSAKDYDLYHLGSFNSDLGVIESFSLPVFVCRGTDAFVGDVHD